MTDEVHREPARHPQDLKRLLVSRERVGDIEGMAALYEPHAVLECNDGNLALGREAIRAFYAGVVAVGRKYDFGDQRPAIISRDLALTSTSMSRWERDCRGRPPTRRRDVVVGYR